MYRPTAKQGKAWVLLRSGPIHALLVGGSRSGKTTLTTEEVLCRAARYPESRHLLARLRIAHARASLWMDTIPKVMKMEGLARNKVKIYETDRLVVLPNESEIWVDGLDDKDRVEKILGREYATIFFNEVSQIPYDVITTVLTRLAQNIPGCINKAFYDLNPVGRGHWAYKLFIQKIHPITEKPLTNPDDYAAMYVNPDDNRENLPKGYIENILDNLPEHKRRRFRLGEWGDPEGVIFSNWKVVDEIQDAVKRRLRISYGLDFGFSVDPAALIWCGMFGDDLFLDELIYETELTNQQLGKRIKGMGIKDIIIADSSEPKSIKELKDMGINVKGAAKGQDSFFTIPETLISTLTSPASARTSFHPSELSSETSTGSPLMVSFLVVTPAMDPPPHARTVLRPKIPPIILPP